MAETATTLTSVLKEAWTSDRMQKQFEDAANPLTRIQKVQATMIGKQAQVPIHKFNAGGFTSFGSAGGSFNTYNNVGVDQATYTLVTQGMPIALEFSALNQAGGQNAQAVIGSKVLAVGAAISEIRKQSVRQLVTNGDGIVAQCATGGASATVSLTASPSGTAWGFDAIQRGWLHVNGIYDIGTTADTDTLVTGTTVTATGGVELGADGHAGHVDQHYGGYAQHLHREPELDDGSECGDERPPQHRQLDWRYRRVEPGDGGPGDLGRGV